MNAWALMLLLTSARAAGPAPKEPPKEEFFDPDNELKHYEHHVQLTDEQKAKVRKLLDARLAAHKAGAAERARIGKKTSDLHDEIMKLNDKLQEEVRGLDRKDEEFRAQFRAMLSDEQKIRFDAVEQVRKRQEAEFKARAQEQGEGERR